MDRTPLTSPPAGTEHIPVTEASARGIARLAKDAEAGHPVIITRHGKPVAAVVPVASEPASHLVSPIDGDNPASSPAPSNGERIEVRSNRRSATERWVQAITGPGRSVPGPPTGA